MPATAISLRLARVREAHAIATMSRDLIEVGLGWKYDAPKIARIIADPEVQTLVALDRQGLAGFAILQFGDERAHLVLLAVQSRCRRQGVARCMMQWLYASAAAAGVAEISLELRAGNESARTFYRAMGFADAGMVNRYYGEHEAARRMLRVLRRADVELPRWRAPTLRRG
jgi:ribosomal protein S18 acetylase RimI-like enzyme